MKKIKLTVLVLALVLSAMTMVACNEVEDTQDSSEVESSSSKAAESAPVTGDLPVAELPVGEVSEPVSSEPTEIVDTTTQTVGITIPDEFTYSTSANVLTTNIVVENEDQEQVVIMQLIDDHGHEITHLEEITGNFSLPQIEDPHLHITNAEMTELESIVRYAIVDSTATEEDFIEKAVTIKIVD